MAATAVGKNGKRQMARAVEMTRLWKAWKIYRESEAGREGRREVSPSSHSPFEIANAIPTFPQPRRRRFSHANQGTFLLGVDRQGLR